MTARSVPTASIESAMQSWPAVPTHTPAAQLVVRGQGCVQILLCTHSFQAPDMYRSLGYRQYGRIEDYASGHAYIHLVKDLLGTR
jgi:hypothetical protein